MEVLVFAACIVFAVFLAGYGVREWVSRIRRRRTKQMRKNLRKVRPEKFRTDQQTQIADLSPEAAAAQVVSVLPAAAVNDQFGRDIGRLGDYVENLQTLFEQEQSIHRDVRAELAQATERFRALAEQTRTLNNALIERLNAMERAQIEFERTVSGLRKSMKDGGPQAGMPFTFRQPRLTEQK
jgi:DNA repair exonuclease SbcCD ATPase subunit